MTNIVEQLRDLGEYDEGKINDTRLSAALEWHLITALPATPCMVRFYCAKLMLHKSDGTHVSPLIEPYRDEANELGYFDGIKFCYLGTGHEVFEFDYQVESDASPTHYQILSPPPHLEN